MLFTMNIKMIEVNHNAAPVNIREKFSFTKAKCADALHNLKENYKVSGCVIVSTCNRMAVWASYNHSAPDLVDFLVHEKDEKREIIEEYFEESEGEDAIRKLFYLSGGLNSLILGDDQILSQLKESLIMAREEDAVDSFIEVLFRMAITAGKKVRTEVNFDRGNRCGAVIAVSYLKQIGEDFSGKKCIVIGNGEMGKLAAQTLAAAGAEVTVTVRQYKSGVVCIPTGCKRINYGERYDYIPYCDYVFSATSSPNMTITRDKLDLIRLKENIVFVDLAVPRDIDPDVALIDGARLYDIDDLRIDEKSDEMILQQQRAGEILEKEITIFINKLSDRTQINNIRDVSGYAGEEVAWRTKKSIKRLNCSEEEKAQLYELVGTNSGNVTQKLLFALQKELAPSEFAKCMDILKGIFQK